MPRHGAKRYDVELLWQILVNGILLGGLYALMALGLVLVWGVLNIVNLAHGALIMLGAYACYYLFTGVGLRSVCCACRCRWRCCFASVT